MRPALADVAMINSSAHLRSHSDTEWAGKLINSLGRPVQRRIRRLDRLADMPYALEDCLFCKIVAGTIPADVVHRDDHVVAFRDINPQAPTHVLLVPTTHYENLAEVAVEDPHGLAALLVAGRTVAEAQGVARSGYRVVSNTGAGAGQAVFHAHVHLLGGRSMGWPPG